MAQTETKRAGKGAPFCEQCQMIRPGLTYPHKEREKCKSWCSHCGRGGHHMSLCYDLKFCNLCGKAGHNPYRCWKYSTIWKWLCRARELETCADCLCPWKPHIENGVPRHYCSHCAGINAKRYLPFLSPKETKESQTEVNSYILQESQIELQEGRTLIDNQKRQIEEFNNKILSLEDKLESSITIINELNWKLQSTVKEKDQELQKVNKLDSLCKQKEIELRNLHEQISQKDMELEQQRKPSSQPYQTIPATAQQPSLTSNHSENINETNCIKATLADLQAQQQKLSVIVNHMYNKIKTQEMSLLNYSSFNPYMGLWDTGQNFNKLQQV